MRVKRHFDPHLIHELFRCYVTPLYHIINYNLFTIFVNDCTNELEIAVDALSKDGIFEQNIEWQTLTTDTNEALKQIRQVICQYK